MKYFDYTLKGRFIILIRCIVHCSLIGIWLLVIKYKNGDYVLIPLPLLVQTEQLFTNFVTPGII